MPRYESRRRGNVGRIITRLRGRGVCGSSGVMDHVYRAAWIAQ